MPALLAALPALIIALLRIWMVSIIGRVLLTIGVGLFAYNVGVPELLSWIGSKFTALPEFVRASAGRARVDDCITLILSALAVRSTKRVFFGKSDG